MAGDVSQMYHQILADQWTGTFIDSCTSPWAVRIQQRFMILRGLFLENEPDVIADVAEQERASDVDLEKRALPTTKTLGVLWVATGY